VESRAAATPLTWSSGSIAVAPPTASAIGCRRIYTMLISRCRAVH